MAVTTIPDYGSNDERAAEKDRNLARPEPVNSNVR